MSPRACPICGSQRTQSCGERAFNCNGCGLIFIMPLETERPEAIYDERYFKGGVYRDYFSEESTMVDYFERKIRLIEKHLPVSGRVLDIGCAAGFFLKAMKKRGYEVSGMDISECATRYARESLGVGITTGDITSASLPADSFDIITMWDVLEHLRDPMVAIRQAHRSLKDTGTLVVETLNIDSLNFKLLGRRWPLWYPPLPYHLLHGEGTIDRTEKGRISGLRNVSHTNLCVAGEDISAPWRSHTKRDTGFGTR